MPTDTAQLLGRQLAVLRQKNKLTIEETAKRSGLHVRTLINLEAGRSNVNLRTLETLTRTYSCTFADLFAAWGKGNAAEADVLCRQIRAVLSAADPQKAAAIRVVIDALFKDIKK